LTTALIWEAVSGGVMVLAGLLLVMGSLIRHRWLDYGNNVGRIIGIICGVLVSLWGVYLLNLAHQGYVVEKGDWPHVERYR
jgi:hypothetical protein